MDFAGKGKRKPQLDIDVSIINLDNLNPRLVPYLTDKETATQLDLIKTLYDYFDTEEIAMSLTENGYFDEEPIIIVPNKKPEDFKYLEDSDQNAAYIQSLISEGKIDFTVVEGNRRISTIKLLTDNSIRKSLNIEKSYPTTTNENVINDIKQIPCIIYENREDVSTYLGVRHILGALKWEAFAKASYIAEFITTETNKGINVNEAVKKVQEVIGDRSDIIKKQYVTYKLFLQAKEDLNDFDLKPIINRFSLLTVAYNSPTIRNYIGVKRYSEVDFNEDLVPVEKLSNLENILTWIYGNDKKNRKKVLTDSRQITNKLSHIVQYEDAVKYLLKEDDLDGAFERTNGEREFLLKKLLEANKTLSSCLQFAYKYKSDDQILSQVDDLKELIEVLKSNLT
ncbi:MULTISPECIES: hypothetical protein [Chryseobacterium]|uniref:ParB/Sulfiredoxin domain-containing protein n=2 Tax=Chryseobacterium TaxID=59732 RepID=A0A0N0IYG5_CHRID|nr:MULTISPECIES: hypothetical protein [Chryseobacterium]KMQ60131.1 hypothetical protein ACM46_18000 [Chryseobacterium angstadtii]KPE53113.1 hypothetical protein AOB46_03775 [Chryseobacterium indologenes]